MATFRTYCHSPWLRELNSSLVTPWGRGRWTLARNFSQTSLHVPFPFADFALSPFGTINPSRERTTVCETCEPSQEVIKPEAVLRTSQHKALDVEIENSLSDEAQSSDYYTD